VRQRYWLKRLSTLTMVAGSCIAQQGPPVPASTEPFVISIPSIPDGGTIPSRYTCVAGPGVVSPKIVWDHAPPGTASFVLVFHDLEPRPAKGIMDNSHWVLWNIPGTSVGLPEGVPAGPVLPDGTHEMKRPRTIPGSLYSYYGPCAPPGSNHHYAFEVYALDTTLALPDDATRQDVLKASDGHILAASAWLGLFHK